MASTRVWPERNPFPYQGTLRIEGSGRADGDDRAGARPPTLLLPPVARLRTLAMAYLDRRVAGGVGHGAAVAVRGEHGTGKTHAIRFVMDEVALCVAHGDGTPESTDRGAGHPTVQVYAKADGPDFLALYNTIVSQIPKTTLREASLRFLGTITARVAAKERGVAAAGSEIARLLNANPDQVFELFNQYEVEEGKVQTLQAEQLDRITGGRRDFRRALSFLLHKDLDEHAYEWLRGRPLPEDVLRKLGVQGPIASDEIAKWGLQLIASVFNLARFPFILYIDQYEKLVLDADKGLIVQNAGLLHSLVEAVPDQNGMIVVCGNEDAWASLPPDLRQRFSVNIIRFEALILREAKQIIALYLTSGAVLPPSDPTNDELFPFKESGIRAIVRSGGGNIRRLLQISSAVFDRVAGSRGSQVPPTWELIDKEVVERTLREQSPFYFDRARVEADIERVLREHGLPPVQHYRIGPVAADFAILDEAGKPWLVIQVSEAIFHDEEIRKALGNVSLVESIQDADWPSQVVLVVLGYISREVMERLHRLVSEVLVYAVDTFPNQFRGVIDRRRASRPRPVQVDADRERLRHELLAVRSELEEEKKRRDADAEMLRTQLNALLQTQAQERSSERRREVRREWAQVRRELEDKIRTVRSDRRKGELEQLEQIRVRVEVENKGLLVALSIALVFGLGLTAISYPPVAYSDTISDRQVTMIMVAASGILIYGVLGLFFFWRHRLYSLVFRRHLGELRQQVGSLRDLERLARSAATAGPIPPALFRDPNPHVRFAAAVALNEEGSGSSPRSMSKVDLRSLLLTERSAVVRRKLAQGARSPLLLEVDIPEKPYIIEALTRYGKLPGDWQDVVPPELHIVVILTSAVNRYASAILEDMQPSFQSLPADLALYIWTGRSQHPGIGAMGEAYLRGFDRAPTTELTMFGESSIRRVVSELSPFDDEGLGRYDELSAIGNIDEMYLFFREFLFRLEHDLLTLEPEGTRTAEKEDEPVARDRR